MHRAHRARSAFTLVEMVVVISIIATIMALLLPALNLARESARNSACANNLRQFGIVFSQHANGAGTLCSGAFDWRRDGCVTEVGWVADAVNRGTLVGQMLCPSSPYQLGETYNDLLTMVPASLDQCVDRLGSQPQKQPDGAVYSNPCRDIATLPPASEARRQIIETRIFEKGYNSNYAASWFLVRSEVQIDSGGNLKSKSGCTASPAERGSTAGPLQRALTETGRVASSLVPLLGCANAASVSVGVLAQPIGSHRPGATLAASFTAGPASKSTVKPPVFTGGTPSEGPAGYWAAWHRQTLQDYRRFGPVHGGGGRRSTNVLFADGGVRSFVDENADGVLNNGFDPATTPAVAAAGFADAKAEMPADKVFSGWSLRSQAK